MEEATLKDLFFFIHIPKAAGTSFRFMLYRQFQQENIFPSIKEIELNGGQYPALRAFIQKDPERIIAPIELIAGHYNYHLVENVRRKKKFMVFLRDPMERTISNLFHIRRTKKDFAKVPLEDIFNQFPLQVHNSQCRYFLRYPGKLNIDEKRYSLAQKHLDRCDFVGISEEFESGVKLIESLFNWNLGSLENRNMNPKNNYKQLLQSPENNSLLEKIRKANEFDIKLYEFAKAKFRYLKLKQQV
jgi:hypothetical protein